MQKKIMKIRKIAKIAIYSTGIFFRDYILTGSNVGYLQEFQEHL